MYKLDGKTALVTGAAHGIGRAIAFRLAEEGCAVGILDFDREAGEAAAEAIRATGAPLVDTSSGVESAPGVKDPQRIADFCRAALAA